MKVINVYEYKPIEWLELQTFNKTFSWEFKNSKSSSELLVKSNQPRTNTKSIIKNNRPSTAIIGNRTKGAFSNGKQYHKKSRYSKAKGDRRETYKMDICAYNSKLISECLQDIKEVNNSLHIYPFKLANCGIQTKYNNKFRQQSIGTNTNNEYGNRKDSKAKSLLQAKNCHSKSWDENYVKKKWIVINPLNVVNISKKMFPKHNKLNLHFNRQKISVCLIFSHIILEFKIKEASLHCKNKKYDAVLRWQ